jgi:hypothetical protein
MRVREFISDDGGVNVEVELELFREKLKPPATGAMYWVKMRREAFDAIRTLPSDFVVESERPR